jgi:hypothetical protein
MRGFMAGLRLSYMGKLSRDNLHEAGQRAATLRNIDCEVSADGKTITVDFDGSAAGRRHRPENKGKVG